jgi:hypothetical protein
VVNLRFHIVSLTAVFLALAVGIFMGSTLLQRATVDSLKARQRSLESKIDQRVTENDAFRAALGVADKSDAEFETDVLPLMLNDQLRDPVVLVGIRGIDEGTVTKLASELRSAGSPSVQTVWLGPQADSSSAGSRRTLAAALSLSDTADASVIRNAFMKRMGEILIPPAVDNTTTTVPGAPSSADERTAKLQALDTAGVVQWSASTSGTRALAASTPRVVVLSGEGASVPDQQLAIPLLRELSRTKGVASAVEVMSPRSSVGQIEREISGAKPVRGDFIKDVRADDTLDGSVNTIDDGDLVYGRLALVLVLAQGPDAKIGHYGQTDQADQQFPSNS